ncbi:MAG: Extracellular solute-binding protein family 5 [Parcubacteria group bacterium Greene0416_79]|nr:MAG: Extracellular solute-binding protein family 5 [Parcubacteria group bacterium Greene0416_79]
MRMTCLSFFTVSLVNESLKHTFSKRYGLPFTKALETLVRRFSPFERVLFTALAVLFALGTAGILLEINSLFLVPVPARGGVWQEGIVGTSRFANPLLALSDADRDLSALVYAGLMKGTPEGTLIPELAERVTVSEDGLTYTAVIREDASFHDGAPITADDVLFTVQKAQDPALKSPKRANWEGVAVEKTGEREVRFTLKQPYAPFLENTTLGILPRHLWKDTDAEQFSFSPRNSDPVGSGPYRVKKIKRNGAGLPTRYELVPFEKYPLGAPHIERIVLRFYQNETEILAALRQGEIGAASGLTPQSAAALGRNGVRIIQTPLPRVFAVFFNQNQAPLFAEKAVREALRLAVDKALLVEKTLLGYGVPLDGPVPPRLLDGDHAEERDRARRLTEAAALLDGAKWQLNEETRVRERTKKKVTERLSFSLVTSNVPELKASAELLKNMWSDIGAEVRLQIFEGGDLNQNVIRPRRYDALLFGEIVGRDLDLFAFWHSSQRNDPGLNVALYANSAVDRLLEEARRTQDEKKRLEGYRTAVEKIAADTPAVFLYSPEFIYVVPKAVKELSLERITIPSERFLSVQKWFLVTERVWNVFAKEKNSDMEPRI